MQQHPVIVPTASTRPGRTSVHAPMMPPVVGSIIDLDVLDIALLDTHVVTNVMTMSHYIFYINKSTASVRSSKQ